MVTGGLSRALSDCHGNDLLRVTSFELCAWRVAIEQAENGSHEILLIKMLSHSPVLKRWLVGLAVLLLALVLIVVFFPWDWLRGPINRHVSEQLGRRFEITQHLSVDLGRTSTVRADGIEFANPEWARDPYLVKAKAAEFDIRLWPLLLGKVELPRISLTEPQIGLQQEPDGRRTWALSRDTSDANSSPKIGSLTVDKGSVKYLASGQGADRTIEAPRSAGCSTLLAPRVSMRRPNARKSLASPGRWSDRGGGV